MAMLHEDQSIEREDGLICHYGWARFVDEVCTGYNCFVCGRPYDKAAFNDEHVIPDWVLRRFKFHMQKLILSNGTSLRYGKHKLRCCSKCNTLLGDEVETPMATITANGFAPFLDAIGHDYQYLPEQWLALVFFKLHLMDGRLKRTLDARSPDKAVMSEGRTWEHFHHIHGLVRAVHTGAMVGEGVLGTLIPVSICDDEADPFDLVTFTEDFTIYVRIGSIGLVHVLDDGGGVGLIMRDFLSRLQMPLTFTQGRELAVRAAYGNRILVNRPNFYTDVSPDKSKIVIRSHQAEAFGHFPSFRSSSYRQHPIDEGEFRQLMFDKIPWLDQRIPGAPTTFPHEMIS